MEDKHVKKAKHVKSKKQVKQVNQLIWDERHRKYLVCTEGKGVSLTQGLVGLLIIGMVIYGTAIIIDSTGGILRDIDKITITNTK